MISANAHPIWCWLKKIIDQKKFSVNCRANKRKAVCFNVCLAPLFHTKNSATPISIYKVVQTGPNNQLGGCHDGLLSLAYQFGISADVNTPPDSPIIRGIARATTSLTVLFIK